MLTRIITGFILFVLLVPMVAFSGTPVLPAVTTALAVIGIYEMAGCCGWRGRYFAVIPAVVTGAGMQWAARIADDAIEVIGCLSLALLSWELICAVFSHRTVESAQALSISGMTIYISFGFASLILLRDTKGVMTMPLAFLLPWSCDTMAYFGGRLFGKHKLIPDVSPKKTVEGAISGTIGAVLAALVYGWLISLISDKTPSYLLLALSGASVGLLSQCGDLLMSLIKRENDIKDYGSIFPGHGGVLDRFDSILISAPALYFIGYFASDWHFFA